VKRIVAFLQKGGASVLYFAFPLPFPSCSRISQHFPANSFHGASPHFTPLIPSEEGNYRHSPRNFALQVPNYSSPPLVFQGQAIPHAARQLPLLVLGGFSLGSSSRLLGQILEFFRPERFLFATVRVSNYCKGIRISVLCSLNRVWHYDMCLPTSHRCSCFLLRLHFDVIGELSDNLTIVCRSFQYLGWKWVPIGCTKCAFAATHSLISGSHKSRLSVKMQIVKPSRLLRLHTGCCFCLLSQVC
jgi:hypothetical protein